MLLMGHPYLTHPLDDLPNVPFWIVAKFTIPYPWVKMVISIFGVFGIPFMTSAPVYVSVVANLTIHRMPFSVIHPEK
jgi:hypothetical protein